MALELWGPDSHRPDAQPRRGGGSSRAVKRPGPRRFSCSRMTRSARNASKTALGSTLRRWIGDVAERSYCDENAKGWAARAVLADD